MLEIATNFHFLLTQIDASFTYKFVIQTLDESYFPGQKSGTPFCYFTN